VITRTLTAVLDAPQREVFDYLAAVENLPEWADEFAHELREEHGRTKVVNALGELFFELRAEPGTGVIDMYAGPAEDELALFPTRVVALPDGRSAFTFTMFKAPELPDELFEAQVESLRRELDNVRARFNRDRVSCRA
jgi:hypothetical protein